MITKQFNEAKEWLYNQPRGLKRKDMSFLTQVMSTLNNPHKQLNIIHVAGTNGKGSTIAFMSQILQQHDYKVARFTSPHLITITERFQINDVNMRDDQFIYYVNQVKALNITLSQFEIFVIIFMLFARDEQVDYTLLEVGVGGLLDSTNFVFPLASVITSIGFDHMDMLGDTIEAIAKQKGGIIKPNCPVFIGELPSKERQIIEQLAKEHHSQCIAVDYTSQNDEKNSFIWQNNYFEVGLVGLHQQHNAALALSVMQFILQQRFSMEKAKDAIKQTCWAGRMEKLRQQPTIYVDGAHNEQGILSLLQTLKSKAFEHKNIRILFSALQRKDYTKMVELLCEFPLYVTSFDYFQAESAQQLASVNPQHIQIINDWKSYLTSDHFTQDDVIIVTGSLYFISEVKLFLENLA